ncbi:MAG: hypothetical protein ACOCQR_03055 [bacterium]
MSELKIKRCNAKKGRYNLDNGNVIVELDVELEEKEISENAKAKVEKLVSMSSELLEKLELAYKNLKFIDDYTKSLGHEPKRDLVKEIKDTIDKAKV